MVNACSDFVVTDLRPLHALEGDGLRSLLSAFSTVHMVHQPIDLDEVDFFLPHRNTVQKNISNHAEKIREKIKKELDAAFGITGAGGAIAIDLWTDPYRQISYLGIVTHYINDNFELCQRIIACKALRSDKKKDANYVLAALKKELEKYDLILDEIKDKVIFVSDRGSNVVKALEQYNHIFCALHFLSNSVKKIFGCGRPQTVLNACKSIVGYVKRAGKVELFDPSLKSTSEVRWNYAIVMMKSIVGKDNWNNMLNVLAGSGKTNLMGDITKEEVESLIEFLEIFQKATKSMESTSKPTIFTVLAWYDKIERFIKQSPADSAIVKIAKQNMEPYFLITLMENKEFFQSKYHTMSNLLHPALKNLVKFSPPAKDEIMQEVFYFSNSSHFFIQQ